MSDSVIFCQSIYACPLQCFPCKVQLIQGAKKFRSNQAEIPKWGGRMGGSAKWEKFPHNPIFLETTYVGVFIGPRCPWSDLCVRMSVCLSVRLSVTPRACVDLTDVTLADEDTNSILTDNANRAI